MQYQSRLHYGVLAWAALVVCFGPGVTAIAQAPDTLWLRRYGGVPWEEFAAVAIATDGGFLAAGTATTRDTTPHSLGWDVWVVKTDSQGQILWNRTYGRSREDRGEDLLALPDGGCLVSGSSSPDTANRPGGLLLRLSADGDSLWSRVYQGMTVGTFNAVTQTDDGGYALCGSTFGTQFWLFKVDENGDSLWSRVFGGPGWENGADLVETAEGNLVAMGRDGLENFWLFCTSGTGDSLWCRSYGGAGYEEAYAVAQTADGGFALAGHTMSFGQGYTNGYVVKTDAQGNFQWQRVFGNGYMGVHSLLPLPDGGVLCGGGLLPFNGLPSLWLTRLTAVGDSVWGRTWQTHGEYSVIQDLQPLADHRYLLAGLWGDAGVYDVGDGFLAVLEPDTFGLTADPAFPAPRTFSLSAFPNPFNARTEIRLVLPHTGRTKLTIYNLTGREVAVLADETFAAGEYAITWNAAGLPSGVYFARMRAREFAATRKLLLLR